MRISVNPDGGSIKVDAGLNERFSLDDFAEPIIGGEGDFVREHVLPSIKDQQISESTRKQIGDFPRVSFQKVGETTLQQAVDMAVDIISATSDVAAKVPAPSGIGGPIDIKVIGRTDPRPVQWQR